MTRGRIFVTLNLGGKFSNTEALLLVLVVWLLGSTRFLYIAWLLTAGEARSDDLEEGHDNRWKLLLAQRTVAELQGWVETDLGKLAL